MKAAETKKTKGILFYALLCTCLGVWGYVFYLIAHAVSPVEDPFETVSLIPDMEPVPASTPRLTGATRTYNGDFRDPFAPPAALFAPKPASSRRTARPAAPEPPPFSLSGVVDETVLLHGADGSAYVARVGEHVGNVQVVSVKQDQVVVRFQGRSHTLHLAQ